MPVVDASALHTFLADDGDRREAVIEAMGGRSLSAPQLIDIDVLSALRRHVSAGILSAERAAVALRDLMSMDLERYSHQVLLPRCWELRPSVTAYDATYVALAELLGTSLLTADARLARAPGPRCEIELLHD